MSSVAAIGRMYAREQKARSARSSMDTSRSSTPAGTARPSIQEPRISASEPRVQKSNGFKTAAQKVVNAVKQHHKDVNSAFDAVYGTHYYKKQATPKEGVRC